MNKSFIILLIFLSILITKNQCFLNIFKRTTLKIVTSRVTKSALDEKTKPALSPSEYKEKNFDVKKFLYKMGYAEDKEEYKEKLNSSFSDFSSDNVLKKMVRNFQVNHNLKGTGELDAETLKEMTAPRCGLPDVRSVEVGTFSKFVLATTKWNKTSLTWKLMNFTRDLGEARTKEITKRAFKVWSDVTPLSFTEVPKSSKADLVLDFGVYVHDYTESVNDSFDGIGKTLAHAAFPSDGRIHFDDDEFFTDTRENINYFLVAVHEIGHALGLEHSRRRDAIMYPTYKYVDHENFTLSRDDLTGIQQLYGKPSKLVQPITQPPTTTTTRITTTTTTQPSPRLVPTPPRQTTKPTTTRLTTTTTTKKPIITTKKQDATTQNPLYNYIPPCMHEYDALFTDARQNVYAIVDGSDLWLFNRTKKNWERKDLFKMYPNLEENVRGGLTCKHNHTFFFKGHKIWAYEGTKLLTGYPKTTHKSTLYPFHPETAVYKNGEFYLIKAHLAHKLNTKTLNVEDIFDIEELFPDLHINIESAITVDGKIYMFKGQCVYVYDPKTGKVQEPKPRHQVWFPCYNYKDQFAVCKNQNHHQHQNYESHHKVPPYPVYPVNGKDQYQQKYPESYVVSGKRPY